MTIPLAAWSSIVKEACSKSFVVAKFLCFLHVTNTYLCTVALSYGPSMVPTISLNGDLVLADRLSPRLGKVGTGDIVILRSPVNPKKLMTKRVLGTEGQSVTYLVDPKYSDKTDTVVVPKGHIWVEGDNVYVSEDSRKFGVVPYALLHSRIFWRIWPPKDFGSLASKAK